MKSTNIITYGNVVYEGVTCRDSNTVCAGCGKANGLTLVYCQEHWDYKEVRYRCRCGNKVRAVQVLEMGAEDV